jgi:hypothetical protein
VGGINPSPRAAAKSNFNQLEFQGERSKTEDKWSSTKHCDSPKRLAAIATKT